LLSTPSGKILQSLVESGVKLGISSRGVGSTKTQGDYQIVQDDFQLICWDFVSEPSTPGAFMLSEGKEISKDILKEIFNKSDRVDRILNEILINKGKK
jgi:lipocalin